MAARPARLPWWWLRAAWLLLLASSLNLARAQFPPPPPPTLRISPSRLAEDVLRTPGVKDVNLTLIGTAWAPWLGVDSDRTGDWLARAVHVAGADAQPLGWTAMIAPRLWPAHVVRATSSMITLLLVGIDGSGWYPSLDVYADEAVQIDAPWWAVESNVTADPSYANLSIGVSVPRVDVRGRLAGGAIPVAELRALPHELQLVLSGADWRLDAGEAGSAAYDALSRAIVGPTSGVGVASGTSGWQLAASGLLRARRENASHLTLVVPPLPAYRIASPEEVHVRVPAEAILQHHAHIERVASFTVLATPGSASLDGSLLAKNTSTREGRPVVGGKSLEVRLSRDTWLSSLAHDDALRRALVRGIRSSQTSPAGWNALVDLELARDGLVRRVPPGGDERNATLVPVGLGNLSLRLIDATTLRLTLPVDAPYSIPAPETVSVTIPAEALTSAATSVQATPALRIDAAGGSATVAGTFIADTLPPTYRNVTVRRSLTLTLPATPAVAWWDALATADAPPTLELLQRLAAAFLELNDTSYDVFDDVCTHANLTANLTAHNASGAAVNGTNGTVALIGSDGLGQLLNGSTNASSIALLANLTANASALLALLANASNATNATASAPSARLAFCASLVNSSLVNGSLVVHSVTYSPYCDPCLRDRRVVPRPFNHTALTLVPDPGLPNSSAVVLEIEVPDAAGVRSMEAHNISVPHGALVALPSLQRYDDVVGGAAGALTAEVAVETRVRIDHETLTVPSGVFFAHNDEASLRSGPSDAGSAYTLEIRLVDDTWHPNISSPVGQPGPGMDVVLGLSSAQSEPYGWNNVVRQRLATESGALHRASDTLLVVRLPGFAEYNILEVETVLVTVPGSAVLSERVIEAHPVVEIHPVAGRASLSGNCLGVREEVVRSLQECSIDVTLTDDAWVDGLDAIQAGEEFVRGLKSVVPQPGGWDTASTGVLSSKSITVVDSTHLTVTVPQMAAFDILSAQQIALSIPPGAVTSNRGFDSNNTIRILPSAGEASLSGTLLAALNEAALRVRWVGV